jgi:hypothetical protein
VPSRAEPPPLHLKPRSVAPLYRAAVDSSLPLPPGVVRIPSQAAVRAFRSPYNLIGIAALRLGQALLLLTAIPSKTEWTWWARAFGFAIALASIGWPVRTFVKRRRMPPEDLPPFGLTIWPDGLTNFVTERRVNIVARESFISFALAPGADSATSVTIWALDGKGRRSVLSWGPFDEQPDALHARLRQWCDRGGLAAPARWCGRVAPAPLPLSG